MPFKVYAGRHSLHAASTFLHACQEHDPLAGLLDPGYLHWYWRDTTFDNPDNQRFWEGRDQTLGMLVLSERHATLGYQVLPGFEAQPEAQALLAEGLAWLERFELIDVDARPSFYLRDMTPNVLALVNEAGYEQSGAARVRRYQDLKAQPLAPVAPPAPYRVRPLANEDLSRGCPPLLTLSAAAFAEVRQSPLYDPELHLVVEAHDGRVIAESLCWWDALQAEALLEPVKVASDYTRRGLSRDLTEETLRRLTRRGARRVKVSHDKHHYAAARLYRSLGFTQTAEHHLVVKRPLGVREVELQSSR